MFNKKISKVFLFLFTVNIVLTAQQSLDIYGGFSKLINSKFRLNSFENNSMNYNNTIDWEFGINGSLIMTKNISNNVQLAFVGKRLGDHYLYLRYTPGFQKAFALNTDTLVTISDSVNVLNAKLSYNEKFGFGYSYNLTNNITVGATFRYFEENYSEENIYFHFSDSVNSLITVLESWNKTHWRGDFGITYQPYDNLFLSLSSANLLILNQIGEFDRNNNLELRTDKIAIVSVEYNPVANLFLRGNYETSSSFLVGADYKFKFNNGNLILGFSVFHDRYQKGNITGMQPSVAFSYKSFSLSLAAIIYSQNRTHSMGVQNLLTEGIHNIVNNQFSYNKISANINLALNFKQVQKVKLIDVKIDAPIFPTLSEEYLRKPFATGTVVNISDKSVTVKPSSFCSAVNNEIIYSPSVTIAANDTVKVDFYTVISENQDRFNKNKIGNASFFLATNKNEKEDEVQKPILVNSLNSWNSDVSTLRYFVTESFVESNRYAKKILNKNKSALENTNNKILTFTQIKILFNSFIRQMQYVADPRSSSEFVQFPHETIEVKGGDCDDLSVAFSSILESIGIETAFVDYKSDTGISHVNLLINTKLKPEDSNIISQNDKKIFIRKNTRGKDEVWIPIEMTSLTDFSTAWKIGSEKFNREAINNMGLANGKVSIHDIY